MIKQSNDFVARFHLSPLVLSLAATAPWSPQRPLATVCLNPIPQSSITTTSAAILVDQIMSKLSSRTGLPKVQYELSFLLFFSLFCFHLLGVFVESSISTPLDMHITSNCHDALKRNTKLKMAMMLKALN